MSAEQMERAAATMRNAADRMNDVFNWWQAESQRQHERNLELVARLEAAAQTVAASMASMRRD